MLRGGGGGVLIIYFYSLKLFQYVWLTCTQLPLSTTADIDAGEFLPSGVAKWSGYRPNEDVQAVPGQHRPPALRCQAVSQRLRKWMRRGEKLRFYPFNRHINKLEFSPT